MTIPYYNHKHIERNLFQKQFLIVILQLPRKTLEAESWCSYAAAPKKDSVVDVGIIDFESFRGIFFRNSSSYLLLSILPVI